MLGALPAFYTLLVGEPWILVKSNDHKRARSSAMRHLLAKSD